MSKQDVMKMQTFVLRVNIQCHCDGCKSRIKKLLQKTDGVYTTQVNTEQGKVTVTGNVDPMKLIKKLEKSGKHAEIWGGGGGGGGGGKGSNNFQNMVNNQFKNMQMESGKGGKGGGGGKGGHPQQQQQQQLQQQHHQILQQQQFKGMPKDFKMPPQSKDLKSVKFNLQGQHQQQQHHNNKHGGFDDDLDDDDDDDFDDDMDDDFDDDDDEDGDFDDEDEEFGHGHGHGGHAQVPNKMVMPNKMMGMMGNGHGGPMGMMNLDVLKGGGGGNGKKGGGGGEFEVGMGKKGGHFEKGKGDSGGKKGGGDSDGKNGKKNKGGQKQEGSKDKGHKGEKSKSKGGMIGGLFGFGCKSTKEKKSIDRKGVNLSEFQDFGSTKKSKGKNGGGGVDGTKKGAAANHHQSNGAKKGGGKQDGAHDFKQMKGFGEMGGGNSYGGGARNMGQQMGSMSNYGGGMGGMPMQHPHHPAAAAVQGLPTAMNNGGGGYYNTYQGMGQQGNPYGQAPHQHQQQQQQYMEMMMNQHRQQGNEMYHPMMYSRPYPPVSYMPPPPMPGPHGSEPYSNFLSDENANSCSIM
ncbi:unnamed protein product [Linum tenue]|uniref:HMA domain-containing protein n=1 Tax=Linum tenue TaxID=586396 RepID=A0AAV0I2R1_9ROSI|nr:unnamed protein product [Linum tenue]